MRERGRSDPEIVGTDDRTPCREVSPDLSVDTCHALRDRKWVETCQEMLNERTTSGSLRSRRSMHAVQQLAHGDHADRAFLVACNGIQLIEASFAVDEKYGVD